MHEILYSPFIVPVTAILAGTAFMGLKLWGQQQDRDRESVQKQMEHQLKLKEMELEIARVNSAKADPA